MPTTGRARSREARSGSAIGQRGRRLARDEQQAGAGFAAAIVQMQQRPLRRRVGIVDRDPRQGGQFGRTAARAVPGRATSRPPLRAVHSRARWLLPHCAGPYSARARPGQSGQRSIQAKAARLHSETRKSAAPSAGRNGRSIASWVIAGA